MSSPGNNEPPRVLFDAERMKYPHTGLYHFCLQLGKHLLLENQRRFDLRFYVPPAAASLFDALVQQQHSLHKFWMPFRNQYQLWHSTYQGTNYFPGSFRGKIILTIHDLNFLYDERKSEQKKQAYLRSLQQKINRADAITAISEFVQAEIVQHFDLGNKQPIVIYNGCNIDNTITAKAPEHPPGGSFIFTIGTIVLKKNFHVLPGLLLNNQHQLVIGGITQDPAYKSRIMDYARSLGVADRIIFTGPVDEATKIWYLQHCVAFAFPSISEGFGLPVIEAMHFGKPVLLSKATSLPEIGGPHAYYFDDYLPETMSSLLALAVKEHAQGDKSAVVQEWARRFNWHAAARQYLQLYQEVLHG